MSAAPKLVSELPISWNFTGARLGVAQAIFPANPKLRRRLQEVGISLSRPRLSPIGRYPGKSRSPARSLTACKLGLARFALARTPSTRSAARGNRLTGFLRAGKQKYQRGIPIDGDLIGGIRTLIVEVHLGGRQFGR